MGWEEVAKTAFEVILDEMRTLFELPGSETSLTSLMQCYVQGVLLLHLAPLKLHYDEVAGRSKPRKKAGSVFASVAYSRLALRGAPIAHS